MINSHSSAPNELLDETLVTTPTLAKVECTFNARYGGIICTTCMAMVPLSRLYNHATRPLQSKKVPKSALTAGEDSNYTTQLTHGLAIGVSRAIFKELVLKELKSKLGDVKVRDVDEENKHVWRDAAVPLLHQSREIMGIRIHKNGVICNLCPDPSIAFCSPTRSTVDNHRSSCSGNSRRRPGRPLTVTGNIQTMASAPGLIRYFPVPGGGTTGWSVTQPIREEDEGNDDDVAAMLRKAKKSMVGIRATARDVLDRKLIHPVILDCGFHDFLKQYDPTELLKLWRIPSPRSRNAPLALRRLYTIVTETFFKDCDMTAKMNPSVRRLIMLCDPYVFWAIPLSL